MAWFVFPARIHHPASRQGYAGEEVEPVVLLSSRSDELEEVASLLDVDD